MATDYVITIDKGFIDGVLGGAESVELDAFDLYDSIIKQQNSRIAKAEFISSIYEKKSENLSSRLAMLEAQCLEANSNCDSLVEKTKSIYEGELAKANEQLEQLKQQNEFLIEQVTSVPAVDLNSKAKCDHLMTELKQEKLELIKAKSTNDELVLSLNAATEKHKDKVKENTYLSNKIAHLESTILSNEKLYENKLKTLEANLSYKSNADLKSLNKALLEKTSQLKKLETELSKAIKKSSWADTEIKKLKAKSVQNREFMETARDGMIKAREKLHQSDKTINLLKNELYDVRCERRYLTLMIDGLIQTPIFKCPEGQLTLYSTKTDEYSVQNEPDLDEHINTKIPLALWIGTNGLASIVAVANNGNIILPAVEGNETEKTLYPYAVPPAEMQDKIVKILSEFDAKKIDETFEKNRAQFSNYARLLNTAENSFQKFYELEVKEPKNINSFKKKKKFF